MIAILPRTARLGLSLLAVLASQHATAVVVNDIAGRSVKVPDKVERVLLGEGRLFGFPYRGAAARLPAGQSALKL